MPTLDWIGKHAVIRHHKRVPYRLLRCDKALSAGDPNAGNLLVQGDNLEALKALLPYYAKKVKCIYIDPPYNTGNESWVYNDNVNDPQVQRWLGKVAGNETDDLSRHDKWLSMMYPRVLLLREFLADDGVFFASIGKDEIGRFRCLLDEIFGSKCHLETFIWQFEGNVENQEEITSTHEYVLAYERTAGNSAANITIDPNVDDDSKLFRNFAENSVIKNGSGNPASTITLPSGFPCSKERLTLKKHGCAAKFISAVSRTTGWISRSMREEYGGVSYPIRIDDLVVEDGQLAQRCRLYSGWQSRRKLELFINNGLKPLLGKDGSRQHFFISHTGVPTYRKDDRKAHFITTTLRNLGTTETASNELERMSAHFPYPKPVQLIQYLLGIYTSPGDVVMDSFAGSGTTGHAALAFPDNEARRFLLIELNEDIAADITTTRLTAAIKGYQRKRGQRVEEVAGLGSGFRFCRLGKALFDEHGCITKDVSFGDLAAHVFFSETGSPLPKRAQKNSPLLGTFKDRAIYLLYNGVLGDRRPRGGNILTHDVVKNLPPPPRGDRL